VDDAGSQWLEKQSSEEAQGWPSSRSPTQVAEAAPGVGATQVPRPQKASSPTPMAPQGWPTSGSLLQTPVAPLVTWHQRPGAHWPGPQGLPAVRGARQTQVDGAPEVSQEAGRRQASAWAHCAPSGFAGRQTGWGTVVSQYEVGPQKSGLAQEPPSGEGRVGSTKHRLVPASQERPLRHWPPVPQASPVCGSGRQSALDASQ
jgi:hypothetical protein